MPYARTARRFGSFSSLFGFSVAGTLLLAAVLVSAPAVTLAQTSHFDYGIMTLGGGFDVPNALAIDGSGNVYVADNFNRTVKEMPAGCASSACVTKLGGGIIIPYGIAVDGSGNVYVGNAQNNTVNEIPPGCVSSACETALGGGFNNPTGLAVDGNGNVYVADYSNGGAVSVMPPNCASSACVTRLGGGFSQPYGLALDRSGNVYVADTWNQAVKEMPAGCTAAAYTSGTCKIATLGGTFGYIYGVAVDGSGNIYVPVVHGIDEMPAGCASSACVTRLVGGLNVPSDVALDGSGNIYVSDMNDNTVKEIMRQSVSFFSLPVGSTSPVVPLTFTFDSPGTIKSPAVLTQGAPNLDFTDAGTGTCTTNGTGHTYAAGDTCTVGVIFSPKHPGLRKGAVVLTNSSSTPIATAYIYGTGTGPQVIFSPPVKSVVGSGFSYPQGVAVDESGNIFFADDNTWSVKEIMAGSGAVTVRGGGFYDTHGVAVDGAGNIFVVDWSAMKEVVAAGGYSAVNSLTGCSYICDVYKPVGVAVDGSGNAFVTNIYSQTLTEYLAAGGYTTANTLASGFTPYGVALDASGNVFVSDTTNNAVKEILAAGGYTNVNILGSGFSAPQGLAVDASGNVFVADTSHNAVKEILAVGGYTTVKTLASGFSGPQGIAVDGSGNVFVSDTGHNAVDKLDFSDPSSLTFATTNSGSSSTDSPRTVTVENDGNETLTFSAVDYPKDFPEASGVDTDCTSSTVLAPGESCTLSIDFSPQPSSADGAVTTLSEQVNITTDHLNLSSAVQSITVKGTENASAPFGHLDGAADARTASTTVVQSDNLHVWGWAADPTDGAPVSQVQILIDGTAVGSATLGLSRSDVKNYPNSGWSFTYPASSLSLGAHTVSAVAFDSLSLLTTLGTAKFTATTPLSGYLDGAMDAQTRSTIVSQLDNLQVWGWAADLRDGAPVSQVQILIDGTTVGNATLGLSRTDVKSYPNSGWSFTYAAAGLSLGTHTVSAIASDSLGFSTTLKILGTNSFTVATANTGPPFGFVDQAIDASTRSSNVGQAGYLVVSGWAADPQDGAPVSKVQVLIDGTAIGNATLGLSRPDVKKYPNSGWWLKVPASGLSLGTHTVSAVATDSQSKSSTLAGTRSITVTTGP